MKIISNLKQLFPLIWKIKAKLFFISLKPLQMLSFKIPNQKDKRIYIFLAADYGNLGDVAITYAQHKFLSTNFPEFLITEIPISKTIEGISFVKRVVSKNDVVTIVGGGNMGDLYESIELYRQLIIQNFKNNKIVSFPQTVDFSDSKKGQAALKKAVKIYSKHRDLILIAREQKSFEYFKTHFSKNKIILTPDIVLSLNLIHPKYSRDGVLVCLRNDKEKKLAPDQENQLFEILNKEFKSIKKRDTHIGGHNLSLKNRVSQLKLIWNDFKKSDLVVTDRLHGMIFCYITGTPCLVFLNNNHKVKSSYYWIKEAPNVHLIEDFTISNIEKQIKTLKNSKDDLELKNIDSDFQKLITSVKH